MTRTGGMRRPRGPGLGARQPVPRPGALPARPFFGHRGGLFWAKEVGLGTLQGVWLFRGYTDRSRDDFRLVVVSLFATLSQTTMQ